MNLMGDGIRTFNSAKKYAEEILHPLMDSHKDAKIKTRLGAINTEEASKLSPDERVVNRFNNLKERIILQQTLANEIRATIEINNVKCEVELIAELIEQLDNLEENFDEKTDDILSFRFVYGIKKPVLSPLFKQLGSFLDKIYVQIQRLMTKNKLLFSSENEEYLEDQELKQRIKLENRES